MFNIYTTIIDKLKENNLKSELVRNTIYLLIVKVSGIGFFFAIQVILARLMGAENYGDYMYVLTWASVLVLLSKMGWDTLLLKNVAIYKSNQEWGLLKGILGASIRMTLFQSLLVMIFTSLTLWFIRNQISKDLLLTFLMGLLLLPILSCSALNKSILLSLKKSALSQTPEMIIRPICIAIFTCFLFFYGVENLSGVSGIIVTIIAAFISLLLEVYYLNKFIPSSTRDFIPIYRNREWVSVAFPIFLVSGTYMLSNRADAIMLGYMLGTKEAGIYSIASRMATLIVFPMTIVQVVAAPMIAELYAKREHQTLQKLVSISSTTMFMSALPIAVGLVLLGYKLLSLFGSDFPQASSSLSILALGQLINAFTGVGGYLMTMTGYQTLAAWIVGVSAALNISLNWVLIPILGLEGAAISTTTTTILWNSVFVFFVWKKLKIQSLAVFHNWN